ncbi:MAG: hypothetical protein AB1554_08955 [Chloroflexota bacterium]
MDLPNIVRRSNFLIVVVYTALLFAIYYAGLFGPILQCYKGYFTQSSFTKSREQLVVWLEFPKYYFKAGPATVYVHVENGSDNAFENVKVYLVTSYKESEPPLLLPNIFNADTYSPSTEIPIIAPRSRATGRIFLITQSKVRITSAFLVIDQGKPERVFPVSEIRFDEAPGKAMQLQVLEHILLPPWSNVYLSALVLISVFLANRHEEANREPTTFLVSGRYNPLWGKEFIDDFKTSTKVLLYMIVASVLYFYLFSVLDLPIYLSNRLNDINTMTTIPVTLPIIIGVALAIWVFKEWNKRLDETRRLWRQVIIFTGFGLAITIGFFLSTRVSSEIISFGGRIAWGVLALEGLATFFMFYRRE